MLGSIFSLHLTFWSDSHGTNFIFKVWEGVLVLNAWELEQISDLSLLTNQVLKVVYSYFKSSLE